MDDLIKEIEKIKDGKDGLIEAKMVDEQMEISMMGTTDAKLSLALFTILKLAKSENVTFNEYMEILAEYHNGMKNIFNFI